MSTPQVLQRLYSLDVSSPDLSRYLYCLIRYDEEEQYLAGLGGSELDRLVDFLDEVRTLPSAFCSVTEQTLQVSRCHAHHRRCFPTMSAQATSYL